LGEAGKTLSIISFQIMNGRHLLLACSLAFLACREKPRPHPAFSAPPAFKEGLVRIFEKYAIVRQALADSQSVLASNGLSAMHGELHALSVDGLDSAAKAYFDSVDMSVMSVLHDTALAYGRLPAVRTAFIDFTPLLADFLIAYGVTSEVPVFLFHCGEERNGRGADWLQSSEAEAGPYRNRAGGPCGDLVRRL
jgi:hypothetical protein